MDDYWDYCLLEGLEEAREERRRQLRAKLVRLIQARSWHLAEYDRRRPRLVYDRDSGIIE
jgi:hypothetical protein